MNTAARMAKMTESDPKLPMVADANTPQYAVVCENGQNGVYVQPIDPNDSLNLSSGLLSRRGKRSSFQITGVVNKDDGRESVEDVDGLGSDVSRLTDDEEATIYSPSPRHRQPPLLLSSEASPLHDPHSRFRLVKIENGSSSETKRRGRWACVDYADDILQSPPNAVAPACERIIATCDEFGYFSGSSAGSLGLAGPVQEPRIVATAPFFQTFIDRLPEHSLSCTDETSRLLAFGPNGPIGNEHVTFTEGMIGPGVPCDVAGIAPLVSTGTDLYAGTTVAQFSEALASGVPLTPLINGTEGGEGVDESSASAVAIDNKIEQAMDLVKSHLMFAVREEVELLKEQIKELTARNAQLEMENSVLRATASSDTLALLKQQRPPPT